MEKNHFLIRKSKEKMIVVLFVTLLAGVCAKIESCQWNEKKTYCWELSLFYELPQHGACQYSDIKNEEKSKD